MSHDRRELGSSAVKAHLGSAQSTHNEAAQASAARLLSVLRLAYPSIQEEALTEGAAAAQGSLIAYLQAKIEGREEDLVAIEDNPHIAATIRLIHKISINSCLTPAEKIKIWKQMKSIASTCPGIDWDDNHRTWSSNRIYNVLTKSDDIVTASPAETMNLVCAAILDTNRYATNNDEDDLGFRIESF